jgi:hypothetical protein
MDEYPRARLAVYLTFEIPEIMTLAVAAAPFSRALRLQWDVQWAARWQVIWPYLPHRAYSF